MHVSRHVFCLPVIVMLGVEMLPLSMAAAQEEDLVTYADLEWRAPVPWDSLKAELNRGTLFTMTGRVTGDLLTRVSSVRFIEQGDRDECAATVQLELLADEWGPTAGVKVTALTEQGFCVHNMAFVVLAVGSRIHMQGEPSAGAAPGAWVLEAREQHLVRTTAPDSPQPPAPGDTVGAPVRR